MSNDDIGYVDPSPHRPEPRDGTWVCERGHRHQAWALKCPLEGGEEGKVVPGAVYRHHRGSFYAVVAVGQDANADSLLRTDSFQDRDDQWWKDLGWDQLLPTMGERRVVVYVCLDDGTWWVRTVEDFVAVVGEDPVTRRFERVR